MSVLPFVHTYVRNVQQDLVHPHYYLVEVLVCYLPVCICLFACYGKILAVWWRQRQRIEPQPANANPTPGSSSLQAIADLPATQTSNASGDKKTEESKDEPVALVGTGPPAEPYVTSSAALDELTPEQRRQKVKLQRREYKAVYLTAAIVSAFVILWFPDVLGRILASIGYNPAVVSYVSLVGGAVGMTNFALTWLIYAAVSKSYRRAYRQMLSRIGCCSCCKKITPQPDNLIIVYHRQV